MLPVQSRQGVSPSSAPRLTSPRASVEMGGWVEGKRQQQGEVKGGRRRRNFSWRGQVRPSGAEPVPVTVPAPSAQCLYQQQHQCQRTVPKWQGCLAFSGGFRHNLKPIFFSPLLLASSDLQNPFSLLPTHTSPLPQNSSHLTKKGILIPSTPSSHRHITFHHLFSCLSFEASWEIQGSELNRRASSAQRACLIDDPPRDEPLEVTPDFRFFISLFHPSVCLFLFPDTKTTADRLPFTCTYSQLVFSVVSRAIQSYNRSAIPFGRHTKQPNLPDTRDQIIHHG
ncbi:hypothetical protein LZ30DRAFT_268982 [Colletotrichum cereale]|nr:hypothetical protein LZ30DRAFT_268982 [Colletotrichum cereale]